MQPGLRVLWRAMPVQTHNIADPSFRELIIGNSQLEQLWTGGRWLEGPAYFADAGILVFSDIPNNRMLRWSECVNGTGSVTVFRQPSRNDESLCDMPHGARVALTQRPLTASHPVNSGAWPGTASKASRECQPREFVQYTDVVTET